MLLAYSLKSIIVLVKHQSYSGHKNTKNDSIHACQLSNYRLFYAKLVKSRIIPLFFDYFCNPNL